MTTSNLAVRNLNISLHIAQENWDTPEQLRVISELRVRYERLAEEPRTAIAALR